MSATPAAFDALMAAKDLLIEARDAEQEAGHATRSAAVNQLVIGTFAAALLVIPEEGDSDG